MYNYIVKLAINLKFYCKLLVKVSNSTSYMFFILIQIGKVRHFKGNVKFILKFVRYTSTSKLNNIIYTKLVEAFYMIKFASLQKYTSGK